MRSLEARRRNTACINGDGFIQIMIILLRHVILVIVLWFSEPEYWFRNGTPVKGLKIKALFVATM
jgi:hypothetical protein